MSRVPAHRKERDERGTACWVCSLPGPKVRGTWGTRPPAGPVNDREELRPRPLIAKNARNRTWLVGSVVSQVPKVRGTWGTRQVCFLTGPANRIIRTGANLNLPVNQAK